MWEDARIGALRAILDGWGAKEYAFFISTAKKVKNRRVRDGAYGSATRANPVAARDEVLVLFNGKDSALRRLAMFLLGRIGDPRDVPAIEKFLDADSDYVRLRALKSLWNIERVPRKVKWKDQRYQEDYEKYMRRSKKTKKKTSPSKVAFRQAVALHKQGKLVEAEKAFLKLYKDFPGTKSALDSLRSVWRMQALAGRPQEACRYRLLCWQEELRMMGDEAPTEGLFLRQYQARSLHEVAEVLANDGSLAYTRLAEAQYVKLIEDYPESDLVKHARVTLKELRRRIAQEEVRGKALAEIHTLLTAANKALAKKDVEAVFALLSPSAKAKYGRAHFERAFKDPGYIAYEFRLRSLKLKDGNSTATVECEARDPGSPDEKPSRSVLGFERTPDGWRISKL